MCLPVKSMPIFQMRLKRILRPVESAHLRTMRNLMKTSLCLKTCASIGKINKALSIWAEYGTH